MKRTLRRWIASLFYAVLLCSGLSTSAFAQTSGSLFHRSGDDDVAHAWLDLLFRGDKLPDTLAANAPNLSAVAGALHRALGIYSTGILVVAALLLFYNLAVLIIETAHYGVPLGRRSAQVWAPMRLILAIGFLVPVSGGLNAGQYLVAWMAGEGSALASNVWEIAANEMKGSFSSLALPKGPDVPGFVAGGVEMELCRALYQRAYSGLPANSAARSAGTIGDIEKLSRTRFAEETWQYSNRLHATVPLCGAYRFAAAHTTDDATAGVLDRLGNELAGFSREQTDKLVFSARSLAETNASVFLGETAGAGLHDDVVSLIASYQAALDDHMHALVVNDAGLIDQTLGASASAGWITSGGIMLELARLQQMYGALAAHALPAVQSPILAEGNFLHPSVGDAIAADPLLHNYTADQIVPLATFYTQIERTAHLARVWLYDRQLADMPIVLANPYDLRDQLDNARDPEAVSSLFGTILNDAAIAYGVWNKESGNSTSMIAAGNDRPLLALPSAMQNAVTSLAEFGRRQAALGNYLFGIAGPDIAPAGTLVYSLLLGAVGLLFMASGFALMFLIPLLPFLRFFLGILAWLLSVIEAIVAIPIVALAHLNFTGEGLSGNAARHAYLLWLNILVRPVLTLFGFIAGLLLFSFGIVFLSMIFEQLTQLAAPTQGSMFVTINVALTFLYTLLAVAAANTAFKGVTLLPELAFKWLGGFIMLPTERADVPVAAGANNVSAVALANLSASPPLLGQRGMAGDRGTGGESRSAAEAHALGLKAALFPNYRDPEKPDAQKKIAQLEKSTESQSKSPETKPESPVTRVVIDAERRDIQKVEKRPINDPEKTAKKKDVQLEKQSPIKSTPIPDEPDSHS